MKTKTTVSKLVLAKDNEFHIKNHEDYLEVVVQTSAKNPNRGGKTESVRMSFPLLKSIPNPDNDQRVIDVIQKCVDTTTTSLLNYIGSTEKKIENKK